MVFGSLVTFLVRNAKLLFMLEMQSIEKSGLGLLVVK